MTLPASKTIFSGIKPSGELHLGNYLGALQNWVLLQADNNCFFCIVDLHAITVPYEPKELQSKIYDLALDYLTAGIDPNKSTLFIQSQVPAHAELAWLLNTITPMGELERMTQYKDKAQQSGALAGLFNYPILMAADILLYHADLVPVGEDQYQHLELTRTLARKFNSTFGDYFKEPKTYQASVPRVMSLLDPAKKMAKSSGAGHYIALSDSPDVIRKKIAKAVSDSGSPAANLKSGGRNLLDLFKNLSTDRAKKKELEDLYRNGELKYSEFKPLLAEAIIEVLKPIQSRRAELAENPKKIKEILKQGREKAATVANKTLREVKERIGLI